MSYDAVTTTGFKPMPTKPLHGVTLWAVPRFHRSDIAATNAETGKEWVNRLRTYSFPAGEASETKRAAKTDRPDKSEICH
jgi:hypothetical protein